MEASVVHLFRYPLMALVAQPFTREFLYYVKMDKRLFDEDFSAPRVLLLLYFRQYIYALLQLRISSTNTELTNDET